MVNLMHSLRRVAIVFEPDLILADTLHDLLCAQEFQVASFVTHSAAARSASVIEQIDLVIAGIPTSDEDHQCASLAEAAVRQNGALPTVLMLRDPSTDCPIAPAHAIRLPKPFTVGQFKRAVGRSAVSLVRCCLVGHPALLDGRIPTRRPPKG